MPARLHADLAASAREVLERNRRGVYTCPSGTLHPHQWLWDSCFIAIGIARYDAPRAAGELRALFRGQWTSGMLPHIIFGNDSDDVGSRRIWQSKKNPRAPRDIDTSCVTRPRAWRRPRSPLALLDRGCFDDRTEGGLALVWRR